MPAGESAVLFRGRAAELLASRVPSTPWRQFTTCPWEDLRHPQRVHVDPFGYLHICQGISIGNLLEQSLTKIVADFREYLWAHREADVQRARKLIEVLPANVIVRILRYLADRRARNAALQSW